MKGKIRYGNSVIQYSIIKSKRRKTSEIQVDKSGVVIRTPLHKSTLEIRKIVQAKRQWIFKKQLELKDRKTKKPEGKTHSEQFLKRRITFFSRKLGLYPKRVNIKRLKSRWGSATKDNIINFNVNLLTMPKDIIDYVIVHELCHLKIKEHSYNYWKLLRHFIPDYNARKKWLESTRIE